MLKYSRTTGQCYIPSIHSDIPADAIDLTKDQFRASFGSLQPGKMIGHDPQGLPILIDAPVNQVALLCAQIDQAADTARSAVAGDPLRAVEYERAALEAQAFADAGYQGEVPPMVAAWAINGRTPQQAADNILGEAAQYQAALVQIRAMRLQAKELIRTHCAAGENALAKTIAEETVANIQSAVAGIGNNAG
ncbi:hypothetical protein D9M69_514550 [compost metagenome]